MLRFRKCTRKNKTALTGMTILSLLCFFIKWLTSWCAGIQTWVAPYSAYCSCGRPWPRVVPVTSPSTRSWDLSGCTGHFSPFPGAWDFSGHVCPNKALLHNPLLNKHKPVLTLGDHVFLHLNSNLNSKLCAFESRSESVTLGVPTLILIYM